MVLRKILRPLLDFCYPHTCPCCGALAHGDGNLCLLCDGQLQQLQDLPFCDRCARPLAQHGFPCPHCRGKGLYPYQQLARLGNFQDPLKNLIYQMKYHRRWTVGEDLADRLLRDQAVREFLSSADALVPVPLHPFRHISRGYNQADVIARRLAHAVGRPVLRPAKRLRNTASQTQLRSRTQREENVKNAFALRKGGAIAGKRIVVVDDVMTSGATLRSLGRVLLNADPASLSAIVLAVADPLGRDFTGV
jgi:ComF family protein